MTTPRDLLEQRVMLLEEQRRRRDSDPWFQFRLKLKQRPFAEAVLTRHAPEVWFIAANRCLTPATPIETAVGERLLGEMIGVGGFGVRTWDGDFLRNAEAHPVFLKGIEPAIRLHLDTGEVFETTRKHRVLTTVGWVSVERLLSMPDDLHWSGTYGGLQANCGMGDRQCGQLLPLAEDTYQAPLLPATDVLPSNQMFLHEGATEPTLECRHVYPIFDRPPTRDDPDRLAALCAPWLVAAAANSDLRLSHLLQVVRRSGGALDPVLQEQANLLSLHVVSYHVPLVGGMRVTAYQEIGSRPILDFEVVGTHCYRAGGVLHHNSGKSDTAAYVGSALARFGFAVPNWQPPAAEFRPTKGWVISASTAASRGVIQPKFFDNGMAAAESHSPFIPQREILGQFNINEQTLRLKNGSVIEFKSAEAKTITFAGGGLDWILIDEELPKPLFDELVIRVGGGRQLLIFGACTLLPPEGQIGGVSWIYNEKIKPWLQNPSGCGYEIYGASIYDNDEILPAEIARLEARYPVGSIERAIRLNGEYLPGMQGARAYPSFDNRIHVRPQTGLEPRRPICWIWDFNVEPMVSLIGQRRGNTFHIYRELILDQGDLDGMVQYFIESVPSHSAEIWVYGDSTGRNRHASAPGGRSEYQIILNAMRTYGAPVRLKVPETNPNVPDRIHAVNRALRDEEGVTHVEIDPSCKELIDDLEGVLRDEKGGIKKSRNRRDPYFRRTHTSDALGYWINYEEPVRSRSIGQRIINAIKQPGYSFGRARV